MLLHERARGQGDRWHTAAPAPLKAIPLSEIRLLQVHRFDAGKTVGLLVGFGATVGLAYTAIIAALLSLE